MRLRTIFLLLSLFVGVVVVSAETTHHMQNDRNIVASLGGGLSTIAAADGLVYAMDGYALTILRYDENNQPQILSRTIVPDASPDLVVKNKRAYLLGDSLSILDVSQPTAPRWLGSLDGFKFSDDLAIGSRLAFAAQSVNDLRVADISNPSSPKFVHQANFAGGVTNVAADGNVVFAIGQSVLRIFDYASPTAPKLLAESTIAGGATDMALSGSHLFITQNNGQIVSVDVSNRTAPTIAGNFGIGRIPSAITIAANRAYIAGGIEGGLRILDISQPDKLRQIGQLTIAGNSNAIAIDGNFVMLQRDFRQLQRIDIANSFSPRLVNVYSTIANVAQLAVQDSIAYVTGPGSGLSAIDISTPAAPNLLSRAFGFDGVSGMAIANDFAYLTNPTQGLGVYDLSKPEQPKYVQTLNTGRFVGMHDVATRDNNLYIAATDGLRIYDITLPYSPRFSSLTRLDGTVSSVATVGNTVYAMLDSVGVYRFDVSNPAMPRQLQLLDLPSATGAMTASGGRVIISTSARGLCIYNTSLICTPGLPAMRELSVVDGMLYASGADNSGVHVFEINEANRLQKRAHYESFALSPASGIAVADDHLYLAQANAGLLIYTDIARQPLPTPPPPSTPVPEAFAYPLDTWQSYYYANAELQGKPVVERQERWLAFNWSNRSPQPGTLPDDNFSARWTRSIVLPEKTTIRFDTQADDGLRIYVDDKLLLDNWEGTPGVPVSAEMLLWAGKHRVRVEYVERIGNASVRITMQDVGR